MAGTLTPRLGLYRADPEDYANVDTDINDNYDILDAQFPPKVCTAGTRPSSPYPGQLIYETDTNRLLIRTVANKWRTVTPRSGLTASRTTDAGVSSVNGGGDFTVGKVLSHLAVVCDGVARMRARASFGGFHADGAPLVTDSFCLAIERYTAGVAAGKLQTYGRMFRGFEVNNNATVPNAGGSIEVDFVPPVGTWDFHLRAWRNNGTTRAWAIDAGADYPTVFTLTELAGADY